MSHTRKIIRNYLCVQFVILLLTLGAVGAALSAERTRFAAYGAPADARQESALPVDPDALLRAFIPDEPALRRLLDYAAALPAPAGCVIGLAGSVLDWFASK